ncbi:MAG: hypothetical protein HON68_08745 [Gammaproteobacteria bacterium]|jgi:hypothetical protein|nr:hypothetical protein [Gammaproteobacteria bacterium]MBT3489120.1 hypothetical protein [Gammaproteobacteria bacterium]MBT3718895.1 hypothetical protein [Gammaproteobacteria bacterium]MBT3845210.1 hypothetical protein [Gammaproteobacteria bacterium]MBT3892232.1 hypothetical protein [Gammaproteobacteria bacterium]
MTQEQTNIPVIPDEYFVAALRLIGMASLEGAYHASEFRKVGEVYDLLNELLEVYAQENSDNALSAKSVDEVEPPRLTIDHLFIIEVAVAFALERGKLDEQKALAEAVQAGFKEHNDAIRKQAEVPTEATRE